MKEVLVKTIQASKLTPDCWLVQMFGIARCKECESLNTPNCGGEHTRALIRAGKFPITGLPDEGVAKNGN